MIQTSRYTFKCSAILAVFILALSGCKDLPVPGNYRGNLTFSHLPQLGNVEKIPVLVDLTYNHHQLTTEVKSADNHYVLLHPLVISKTDNDSILLEVPDFPENQKTTFLLKKIKTKTGQCYQSPWTSTPGAHTDDPPINSIQSEVAHLCFDKDNFNLNIEGSNSKRIHLYGTQFKPRKALKLEEPESLTVLQGVDRILAKNYGVQESLQLLLRANQTANRAYINLIPHINLGGVIKLGQLLEVSLEEVDPAEGFDAGEVLDTTNGTATGLIPFIFPGRWFKAKQASWEAKAQEITNTLFQINMGTSVQSMSIAFHAHKELRDELQELQNRLGVILKIGQLLVEQKRLDPNSILTIEISLSDLNVKLWQAQNQFMQDRMAISQILGFENPEAIEDMILERETTTIEDLPTLDHDQLEIEKRKYSETALRNSFELRQLEYLHRAAVTNKKNMYLEWMDVASSLDLGFKLISESKILDSIIKSVEIKSSKTRQNLIAKAYNLVRDRNILRENLSIFETSLKIRRERVSLLFDRFHQYADSTDPLLKPIPPSEIRGAVADLAAGLGGYYGSRAAILIDQTELDRMALKGVYEKFLPHLDENEISNEPTNYLE